ncbi:MAG: GPI mannosyltransferase 1 [Sclerophora amabilis]|nr:MAG: GPI mannosyltransferase 1 [Sclerophora amabilis]
MPPSLFSNTAAVFSLAILLRLVLLLYGRFQDAHSPMKYTDIDYFVFTDAARFTAQGRSPYERDTYRYTPLLVWLLLPTTWRNASFFSFGKVLFASADILAGWLILKVLRPSMSETRALKFASIWLLNPMVATISTRGSSEGLLGVMVVALLWSVMRRKIVLAGCLLGLAVHFKIYPFIYAASIVWWLDDERPGLSKRDDQSVKEQRGMLESLMGKISNFLNPARVSLAITSLSTFMALNLLMYYIYGSPFIQHTYLHHVTRIDHRHNFSPYNTLLYLHSSPSSNTHSVYLRLESVAFLPQLLLSTVVIPLCLAKRDLPSTMLAQTLAFVTFNKTPKNPSCDSASTFALPP